MLMRNRWPGNVEQLYQVLRKAVARRRAGVIAPGDLPPECRAITRRGAHAAGGDRVRRDRRGAAGQQRQQGRGGPPAGMSRATIYRKIRDYGITLPVSPEPAV